MIAFVVCLLVIAGVSSGAEKVIRVAVGIDATSLDPPMSTNLTDKNTTSQIYDTLIFRNKEMKLEPHLATSWKIINNTTWEMELRKGIKFHNGEEFNAEAVKFSIERILDPAMKAPSFAQFTAIKGVKIIDPYKVHIETKEPYPVLPAVLAECWAVPPRYTQEKGK
jgi:peptide/nickel transport system substrate-binding protein